MQPTDAEKQRLHQVSLARRQQLVPAEPETHAPAGVPIKLRSGLRYDQLLNYIRPNPSLSILEVGVARASTTLRILAYADMLGGKPDYVGIDLFECLTDMTFVESHCSEGKRPVSKDETFAMLAQALGADVASRIALMAGDSRQCLAQLRSAGRIFDLIFIDGGHSEELVRGDWNECQHMLAAGGTILFDDYPNWGILPTIESIDRTQWNVRPLEDYTDVFRNIDREVDDTAQLRMFQLVEVTRRASEGATAVPGLSGTPNVITTIDPAQYHF